VQKKKRMHSYCPLSNRSDLTTFRIDLLPYQLAQINQSHILPNMWQSRRIKATCLKVQKRCQELTSYECQCQAAILTVVASVLTVSLELLIVFKFVRVFSVELEM
jgi:hypothetical protein